MSKTNSENEQLQSSIAAGRETSDLNVRGILVFGLIVIVLFVGAVAVITPLLAGLSKQGGITFRYPILGLDNVPPPTLPPEPRLESAPGQVLVPLRAGEQRTLDSYGWVDQKAGVVRIPIERAMDLLAERGLPVRPMTGQYLDQGQTSPSYPSSGREQDKYP